MALSARAQTYLDSLTRVQKWVVKKEALLTYFNKQNFTANEILIEIQLAFSGYKLTIENDSGHTFLLNLFSQSDIKGNKPIRPSYCGDAWFVAFGEHKTAQFNFFLSESGALCTLDPDDNNQPNIICSSIEKFIEQYALQNKLAAQQRDPYYHNVLQNEPLTRLLNQEFDKIQECSDRYSQWYSNNQLTVVRGTWLDRPEFYVHVYGYELNNCNRFIERLQQAKII